MKWVEIGVIVVHTVHEVRAKKDGGTMGGRVEVAFTSFVGGEGGMDECQGWGGGIFLITVFVGRGKEKIELFRNATSVP